MACDGAHFANRTENGSGYALVAASAEIGGDALLRDGFAAEGCVSLHGAKIGGNLECDGAHFANRTENGSGVALLAEGAEIGGAVLLGNDFTAEGRVFLLGAKIGGTLACDGAHFANHTEDGSGDALTAEGAEIGRAVLLRNDFTAEGRVSLLGAKIGGNLACDGAHFANRTENGSGVALTAQGATIGGDTSLRNGFMAEGCVSLLDAKIGGLYCDLATLRNHGGGAAAITLNLTNATIDRDARLRLVSIGGISIWGCRVGRNVDCTGATFLAWPPEHWQNALYAANLTAGGDVILDDATVLGRLVFEHAEITGSLQWDGIRFPLSVPVRIPHARGGEALVGGHRVVLPRPCPRRRGGPRPAARCPDQPRRAHRAHACAHRRGAAGAPPCRRGPAPDRSQRRPCLYAG